MLFRAPSTSKKCCRRRRGESLEPNSRAGCRPNPRLLPWLEVCPLQSPTAEERLVKRAVRLPAVETTKRPKPGQRILKRRVARETRLQPRSRFWSLPFLCPTCHAAVLLAAARNIGGETRQLNRSNQGFDALASTELHNGAGADSAVCADAEYAWYRARLHRYVFIGRAVRRRRCHCSERSHWDTFHRPRRKGLDRSPNPCNCNCSLHFMWRGVHDPLDAQRDHGGRVLEVPPGLYGCRAPVPVQGPHRTLRAASRPRRREQDSRLVEIRSGRTD